MRAETSRAFEALAVAVVVGMLHVALLTGRFSDGGHARGAITVMLGSVFITGVLWAMLALRALAADGAWTVELDDALTAMAVTAWVVATAPPRASNFLPEGGTDDFAWVYVPLSLVAVGALRAARHVWPVRTPSWLVVRLCAAIGACGPVVAVSVLLVSKGAGSEVVAAKAVAVSVVAAAAALLLRRRA